MLNLWITAKEAIYPLFLSKIAVYSATIEQLLGLFPNYTEIPPREKFPERFYYDML